MIINYDDGNDDGNVHDNLDRDWKNNYITISNRFKAGIIHIVLFTVAAAEF